MKLAVVTNILTPYRIPLFEALRRRVDDFTVLLMARHEENRHWQLEQPPFKTAILPGFHWRPPGRSVSVHFNYGVMSVLRRLRPDVVLSGGFTPANLSAFLYCKLFRKKFIGWGELTLADGAESSHVRRLLRRWLISGSDGSIASSSDARDAFAHYGAAKHRILLNIMPIEVEKLRLSTHAYRQSTDCQALRERLGAPILLSVGRLTRTKGYVELFQIYQRLLALQPHVSLVIVGDGPERTRYEDYVRQRGWKQVHFVGFVQASALPKYLAVADRFVFHTLSDPFGAVLSEAMAAELPAISSVYASATRDLIEDGVTGFRIDPKDPVSAAATIAMSLEMSSERLASLRRAAYDRVKLSDIEVSADRMMGFIHSLLGLERTERVEVRQPIENVHG